MRDAGVVLDYALFGAIAQMRYTEAVVTIDVAVLVSIPPRESLDLLGDIYSFCAARGWQPEGEAIRVGPWPVRFVAASSALTTEAMERADTADFDGVPLRVVRADYLGVIALSVGRAKNFARILALLESGSVTEEAIERLAALHGLTEAWQRFRTRFLDA